jgi:hypothetical protein
LESGPPAASIERCRFEIYSEIRQKNAGKRSEEELATRKKKKRKEKTEIDEHAIKCLATLEKTHLHHVDIKRIRGVRLRKSSTRVVHHKGSRVTVYKSRQAKKREQGGVENVRNNVYGASVRGWGTVKRVWVGWAI